MALNECAHHWTVTSECPYCLRRELTDMEGALLMLRNLFDPYGDGRLVESQSSCADACRRADGLIRSGT